MVGDAVLGKIIRADLLRAVTVLDLPAALGGDLLVLLGLLHFVQPGAEHAQGLGLVLDLRLFVLLGNHQIGGQVRDAHSRVRGIDRLPARAGRTEGVNADVFRVYLDVNLVGLGQHRNRRRGGVDAALLLGFGHALYAVHAAFVFQLGIDLLPLDGRHDYFEAAKRRG